MADPDRHGHLIEFDDRCGRRGGRYFLGVLAFAASAGTLDFGEMERLLTERFGVGRVVTLREWRRVMDDAQGRSEPEKLQRINAFFNRNVAWVDDIEVWNQSDYWATPLDTIGQGKGDCEDYSIGKYFSLIQIGVPIAKLRLIYVNASRTGATGSYRQAHMVLAYYASPRSEPLLLDNLNPEIRPASQRSDLQPVFSFNSDGIWAGAAADAARGKSPTGQLSRWADLLQRARHEGFE